MTLSPVPSDDVAIVDLATAVANAASGVSLTELHTRTGLSMRTLREIINGNTERTFGRATLDKLDRPLGWTPGTAWRHYRRQASGPGEVTMAERLARVEAQMSLLHERVGELHASPSWSTRLVDICLGLSDEDRQAVIAYAERLARH